MILTWSNKMQNWPRLNTKFATLPPCKSRFPQLLKNQLLHQHRTKLAQFFKKNKKCIDLSDCASHKKNLLRLVSISG
uniref:Ribosome production factor 1-like n=1 Tax=Rhizophora mucronata TaxID=61149 RepID=A0A2P2LM46_RHIMU